MTDKSSNTLNENSKSRIKSMQTGYYRLSMTDLMKINKLSAVRSILQACTISAYLLILTFLKGS